MGSSKGSFPVSVIIVNYNSGVRVSECVASVLRFNPMAEVIVVDNASTDNSMAQLQAICPIESRLNLILSDENRGFSSANNTGVSIASGESLLFLNPDCVLEPDTIDILLEALHSDDDVAMVGGFVMNPDGSEQVGARRAIPTPWRTFVKVSGLSCLSHRYPRLFTEFNLHKQTLPEEPIDVEAISGACMLVSREAYEHVGGMDEEYFLHCEDLDWCMGFRAEGWKILFVPAARLVHYLGSCSKARPVFVEWHKHKGMVRFYRKFFKHQYPGAMMWLVIAGVWLRFGLVVGALNFKRFVLRRGRNGKQTRGSTWRDEPGR